MKLNLHKFIDKIPSKELNFSKKELKKILPKEIDIQIFLFQSFYIEFDKELNKKFQKDLKTIKFYLINLIKDTI